MQKNKIVIAKIGLILGAVMVPLVINAYEFGPDPRRAGAPGDAGTCLGSGCHSGALNPAAGSVSIVLPNGNTYTPGVKQHIKVQVTDPTRQKFGFQLTARLASNASSAQAGDFSPSDNKTQVICEDGGTKSNGASCPSGFPVQFIEHTVAGYTASTSGGYTFEFDWTPPAANAGDVKLYVAANAGPGGAPVSTNANIYTANVTLTAQAAAAGITVSSVQDAESGRNTLVPGEWAAIYGTNLAPADVNRTWAGPDFNNGNNLPKNLSGVSVKFSGVAAAVYYVSPAQLDVQVPEGLPATAQVVVSHDGQDSAPAPVAIVQNAPSFFFYPAAGKFYPAATHLDGSLIGDPAALSTAKKVKAGETVVFYVNGVGPSPAGIIIPAPINFTGAVSVNIGSTAVTPSFVGLVAAGEYQVNVAIPASLQPGDYPLTFTAVGQTSTTPIVLPVQ